MAISTTPAAMSFMHKLSFARQQVIKEEEDELETAKAQMGEVREENERLKMMLQKIDKDYQSLRLRFNVLRQENDSEKATDSEAELVSLCLGMSTDHSKIKKDGKNRGGGDDLIKTSLSLGLDSKFQLMSTENSSEEPSKVMKTMRSGDDEGSQQALVKRARVSVRVRCDTQTVNDGCQWRKYGQKIAKGNPCPRGYYRCTVAPGCPVRKQVQRCMEDMSILITTYEGTHNHSLPMSATAMASTTSAAASMLLSGSSSTSRPSTTATQALFNGSNYRQFCNSPSFPTITLDLTSSPSSSYSTQFMNQLPSGAQRYPSADLGFSSLESNMIWANKSDFRSLNFGQHSQVSFYQPNMEKTHPPPQQFLTETLTRAITSNPNLCSAIEAAISSMARD